MTWAVERAAGPAAGLHARELAQPATRAAWLHEPVRPALVLGSGQRLEVADHAACRRAGAEVVRRRSGGGAVLLVPGEVLWVDLVVPAGDALWDDDVGRAARWVGHAWVEALADLGVDARAHEGPPVRTPWADLVCFAGLAPGEVVVRGRKVVGTSQRRTRHAARFQCAALGGWDARALVGLLALGPADRERALLELPARAAGVGVDLAALADRLLARLPA